MSVWSMGFWWGGDGVAPSSFSGYWGGLTHVIVAGVSPDGSGNLPFFSDSNYSSNWPAMVSAAHANGVKALLNLTDIEGGSDFNGAVNNNLGSLVANIASMVNAYGFDGIDVDWEKTIQSTSQSRVTSFFSALRSALGSKVITADVFSCCASAVTMWTGAHQYLDRINSMTYDGVGTWQPYSWFNASLYAPSDHQDIHSNDPGMGIDLSLDMWETVGGIPASKINLGIPFYGYTAFGSATGPRQAQNGGTSFNQIRYSRILSDYPAASSPNWDSASHTPWIPISGGWLTFDNPQSVADKINYAKDNGWGGAIIFNLAQDTMPDGSHPLLGAVQTALTGSSPSPTLPTIYSFASDTTTVAASGPVTFTWSVGNATSLSINGTTVTGTSHTFNPTTATDYVLTATNADGSVTSSSIHIAIGSGAPSIASFTATPSTIVNGQSVTLSWAQSLGTSASIDNGVGDVTGVSSKVVNPSATTTYRLTVTNTAGTVTRDVTVTLGTLGDVPPAIASFTASATTISTPGAPVTLSFAVSGAPPEAITINDLPVSGSTLVVNPLTTTTYILAVQSGTTVVTQSLRIIVRGATGENIRYHQIRLDDRHGSSTKVQMSDGTGLLGHLAAFTADGSLTDGGMGAITQPFLLCAQRDGTVPASYKVKFDIPTNLDTVAYPANMTGSKGGCDANPTATVTWTITDNGGVIGTMVVSTSGVYTFTSTSGLPGTVAAGHQIALVAPSPPDATYAGFDFTLAWTRRS